MSDMRDFRTDSMIRPLADDDFNHLRLDESVTLGEPIRDDIVIIDDGGLGDFHINNDAEEEGSRRSKIFAGVAVAALVAIGGAYGISVYMKDQPVVADESLPSPSAPSRTAAMPPPPAEAAEATAPATAPTAPDVIKSTPVTKQAATANAPKVMAAPRSSSTTSTAAPLTPEQQYTAPAVTPAPVPANAPEPVSPTPPASVQAGNPALNRQSVEPEQTEPAAPQAAPAAPEAAPAQTEQAPTEPAPAQ